MGDVPSFGERVARMPTIVDLRHVRNRVNRSYYFGSIVNKFASQHKLDSLLHTNASMATIRIKRFVNVREY